MTLNAYLDGWLALLRTRVQPTTHRSYDDMIHSELRPLLGTGMRRGELLGPTWEDLDLTVPPAVAPGVHPPRRAAVAPGHDHRPVAPPSAAHSPTHETGSDQPPAYLDRIRPATSPRATRATPHARLSRYPDRWPQR